MKDLMMMLGHVAHKHRKAAGPILDERGMSGGQPPILKYLSEHDGCIQRDLADNCHIKPATVSSVLDNMEQNGYIQRRPLKEDRRAYGVFLTKEGWEKHKLAYETFMTLERQCFVGISEEERQIFESILERILDNIQKIQDIGEVTEDNV